MDIDLAKLEKRQNRKLGACLAVNGITPRKDFRKKSKPTAI